MRSIRICILIIRLLLQLISVTKIKITVILPVLLACLEGTPVREDVPDTLSNNISGLESKILFFFDMCN